MQKHLEERVALEEGRRKVLQVADWLVVCQRPVDRKVKAILIPRQRIGKVPCVGPVGDDKDLQILVERVLAVEALLTIPMHLIKCLTYRHATSLQLYLHHRQTVDQDRHVVAVCLTARLLKLIDHLHLIA